MFDTGDWNDNADARRLSKSLHHHRSSAEGAQGTAAARGIGQRLVKKQLLETLRMLEAASQRYQDAERPLVTQDVSRSEEDEADATVTCSKHRKKRSRKRKQGLSLEISRAGSQIPLKAARHSIKTPGTGAETPLSKLEASRGAPQDGPEKGKAVQNPATKVLGESADWLSRKKWRNQQKNKKRNKNKFKVTAESKGTDLLGDPGCADSGTARPAKNGAGSVESSEPGAVSKGPRLQARAADQRRREGQLIKLRKILQQGNAAEATALSGGRADAAEVTEVSREGAGPGTEEPPSQERAGPERSAALRCRMEERLKAARFRYINQQLYTSSSREARQLFLQDPEAFQIYHHGFVAQLQRWPQSPIDGIIKYLRNRPASLVVADFGCGDCKIARSVRNKVHSFDLMALNDHVTVCDMAKVPLQDESVDVAVFCLALMGTNLREFFEEANRVLKPGGILKVAEVASRFEDIRAFISALSNLGFKNISKDTSNNFFYTFDFSKSGRPRSKGNLPGLRLKACLYKKR
ncbi:ribosomal RNA-processing protein 8 [Rhinatrema bivittatum]|uniref:ribosomal RNA-processing protein 8 n=1 Tax=Rhinatrema bivittatum TaxID=194408 RepID=UPI00112BCB7B|nr:ribosomal RNA-processing protein 8 [Rhinatrema bivittatum]